MTHKKTASDLFRRHLEDIANSAKKTALIGVGAGILATNVAKAQTQSQNQSQNVKDTVKLESRFSAHPPFMVIKPGQRYELFPNFDPNAMVEFRPRANYDQVMNDLATNRYNMDLETRKELVKLLAEIKCSSMYDKAGWASKEQGEDLCRLVDSQLSNVEKINTDSAIIYRKGVWNEKETAELGKYLKSQGIDKVWTVLLASSEGYNDKEKSYIRDDDFMILLLDSEGYEDIQKDGKSREPKPNKNKSNDANKSLNAFYFGLGGDYSKHLENRAVLVPQIVAGVELGRFNFGIKAGYRKYMDDFLNGQANGYTRFNMRLTQFGVEGGYDITKTSELFLGYLWNMYKGNVTQQNVNPATGSQREVTMPIEPSNSSVLTAGLEKRFGNVGLYGAAVFNPNLGRLVGGEAGLKFHFGNKHLNKVPQNTTTSIATKQNDQQYQNAKSNQQNPRYY